MARYRAFRVDEDGLAPLMWDQTAIEYGHDTESAINELAAFGKLPLIEDRESGSQVTLTYFTEQNMEGLVVQYGTAGLADVEYCVVIALVADDEALWQTQKRLWSGDLDWYRIRTKRL